MHSPSYFMCRLFERTSVLSCRCCCRFAFSTCQHSHVLKSQMHQFVGFFFFCITISVICARDDDLRQPIHSCFIFSSVTLETGLPERVSLSLTSFFASLYLNWFMCIRFPGLSHPAQFSSIIFVRCYQPIDAQFKSLTYTGLNWLYLDDRWWLQLF